MKITTGGFGIVLSAVIATAPLSGANATSDGQRALLSGALLPINTAPIQLAQATAPRRALVQQVQDALIRLGYDPGPADGLIGDRTTRSVRSFQQRAGLPIDGRVTEPLYRTLLAALERPAPSASAVTTPLTAGAPASAAIAITRPVTAPTDNTVPNAAAAAGATFVDSVWTITDPGGATLRLRLLADGRIAEVESPVFWRWQLRGDEIRISYDNKLGGKVERRGRIVSANELRGEANSSRERTWTWRARRVVDAR